MDIKKELINLKDKVVKVIKKENYVIPKVVNKEYTEEEIRELMEALGYNSRNTSPAAEAMSEHFMNIANINLNNKVKNFIDWYYKNLVKGKYTDIGEFHLPKDLENFIEKVAVWYELRYPDYEINRKMPGSGQELKHVSEEMFSNNPYIEEIENELSILSNSNNKTDSFDYLEWDKFYNTKAFINSLPISERQYLSKPRYASLVYLDDNTYPHFHISAKGIVTEIEGLASLTTVVTNKELVGKHVKEVLEILKNKIPTLPQINGLTKAIKGYEIRKEFKERLLDSIMYRIIERGGNRFGPRRGFIFAKEFGRNIDIPMSYGIDTSDPGLDKFIEEYLNAGGRTNLICYPNYFSRKSDFIRVKVKELNEYIKEEEMSIEEEKALYQRMANVIASRINPEELKIEEIKQLRLERKLNKSKQNKC